MSSPRTEPEQPPYWAWSENPDTGQGLVHDVTGTILAYCSNRSIARRIAIAVNTFGNQALPAEPTGRDG